MARAPVDTERGEQLAGGGIVGIGCRASALRATARTASDRASS